MNSIENAETDLDEFFAGLRATKAERQLTVAPALAAMDRLAIVLQCRSGQPYELRGLLYSLYNGQPSSLLEIVVFDWPIRKDLICVLSAFGHDEFFYDEMKAALVKAGVWEWFIEAHIAPEENK